MKKILFSLLLVTILFSCSKNGDKVSQDFMEVYYKDGITKQEAQKALDYFLPRWKEKDGETARKSIQLTKNGDTINFKIQRVTNFLKISLAVHRSMYCCLTNTLKQSVPTVLKNSKSLFLGKRYPMGILRYI